MEDDFLKLVFWGRCNPEKGLHIVIDAILILIKIYLLNWIYMALTGEMIIIQKI